MSDPIRSAPVPTAILLPADSTIPSARGSEQAALGETALWQQPHTSLHVRIENEEDREAWFHFCHGHHIEFLYWEATALACRRVTAHLTAGEREEARRWLERAATLIRGSGAMLYFCGALDAETYDRCLRPSMEEERDDFSGDMSRDFLAMMAAKADVVDALEASGDEELHHEFHHAEQVWYAHHGEVVRGLHPGKSLLQEKVEELERDAETFDYRAYVENVVRGEQALDDYDEYFGVTRSDSIGIDEYWTQALEKLATVHRSFSMKPKRRAELMRGDATLLGILSRLESESAQGG